MMAIRAVSRPGRSSWGTLRLPIPGLGHLEHGQRLAREGFGLAEAATGDTDVVLDDWRLVRNKDGSFTARAGTTGFALDLQLNPTQAALLQGDRGYSRKGPGQGEASAYFSMPHLAVTGRLTRGAHTEAIRGEAWLDREWSSSLLNPRSVGWDWAGLNMDDGSAVTVFRVRDAQGHPVWAGGSVRAADGALTILGPGDVAFATRRRWRSPRTGADYPVETTVSVTTPAGTKRFELRPLMDDQELDTRRTGGPVYWEGAVEVEGRKGLPRVGRVRRQGQPLNQTHRTGIPFGLGHVMASRIKGTPCESDGAFRRPPRYWRRCCSSFPRPPRKNRRPRRYRPSISPTSGRPTTQPSA